MVVILALDTAAKRVDHEYCSSPERFGPRLSRKIGFQCRQRHFYDIPKLPAQQIFLWSPRAEDIELGHIVVHERRELLNGVTSGREEARSHHHVRNYAALHHAFHKPGKMWP